MCHPDNAGVFLCVLRKKSQFDLELTGLTKSMKTS